MQALSNSVHNSSGTYRYLLTYATSQCAFYIVHFLFSIPIFLWNCSVKVSHLLELVKFYCWTWFERLKPTRRFQITKLPRHIAFVLLDHRNTVDDAVKLVLYCALNGIYEITIYEPSGSLIESANFDDQFARLMNEKWLTAATRDENDDEEYAFELLLITKCTSIRFNLSSMSTQCCAGNNRTMTKTTKNLHTITVMLHSGESGRTSFVKTCRKICEDVQKKKLCSAEISVSTIRQYLRSDGHCEPDFLVKFGNISSLMGYQPFCLRVTEIYDSPCDLTDFDELIFLETLESYSKRNQRFGK